MMTHEQQARLLRLRAQAIEHANAQDGRYLSEEIPEFGLPSAGTLLAFRSAAAQARELRARAAEIEGDDASASRYRRQAEQVLRTGSYD
jgi:homoserine acetyltransferase